MYLQEILEVAIGLVFVWLMLALTCMGIQEWIAGFRKFRAKDLEKSIGDMLADPTLAAKFYDHPLIKGLSPVKEPLIKGVSPVEEPWYKKLSLIKKLSSWIEKLPSWIKKLLSLIKKLSSWIKKLFSAENKPARPSYIPKDTFAQVLFEMAMTAGTETSTIKVALANLKNTLPDKVKEALSDELIERIGNATFEEVEKEFTSLTENHPDLKPMLDALLISLIPTDKELAFTQLRRGITAWVGSNPQVAQTLSSLTAGLETSDQQGEDALAAARTNAENYFNNGMDRLGGWYKRRAQLITFVIGITLALVLNIDSAAIATTLWREPTIRQALVLQAESYDLPAGTDAVDPGEAIRNLSTQIGEDLQLPIGWTFTPYDPQPTKAHCKFLFTNHEDTKGFWINEECVYWENPQGWEWMTKILGLSISALAAMQGAPLWFDMLKKLINVRSAGIKPDEKKENGK